MDKSDCNMKFCDRPDVIKIKDFLKYCFEFFDQYQFLTETYIIEFFTNNHWEKLPKSWQVLLEDFEPSDVAESFLNFNTQKCRYRTVWPLSLLAFKKTAQTLSLPRSNYKEPEEERSLLLQVICERNVKAKKQHEIQSLSKIIVKTFFEASCTKIIDVGSGQGHLSRAISIGYDLPVVAIEHESTFLNMATLFDDKALQRVKESVDKDFHHQLPRHVRYTVFPDVNNQDFVSHINNNSAAYQQQRYLLTGLHACGDLSATMIRIFKENPNIEAIVSVACCYMKLTTDQQEDEKVFSKAPSSEGHYCYPMSDYVKGLARHELPYRSRKVACDAVEGHMKRLQKDGGLEMKVHCHRAVLEYLLRILHPEMIRPGVQTIKKAHLLPFSEYVKLAFQKLNLPPPNEKELNDFKIASMLKQWRKVVTFFTLSLMVGPVIESIILLDRWMHLFENGLSSEIIPVFDPILSPRCFAIVSRK